MDIFWWVIGVVVGGILGRTTAPERISNGDKKLQEENQRLREDVDYYKKLTRELAEENKEFRRKLNESK